MSEFCRERDWLVEAGKSAGRQGLRLISWTIGTHNSRLGEQHPDLTQQNVYGDRLPYALCPANEEVIIYLEALCRDLATNYPLWGLQLECFGWMNVRHGHHHERDLVGLSHFEAELLSICFCAACETRARSEGVNVKEVKNTVRKTLDGVFREAPGRPRRHPLSLSELEDRSAPLRDYNHWRAKHARWIIQRIKSESLRGTACRLLLQTGYDEALSPVVDGFACAAYRQNPNETLATCRSATRATQGKWNGLMQCLVQLGLGIPDSEKQLRSIVRAVRNGGCNGINFYNYSESPPKMLGWLPSVMREFAE
jgi:hypothetical protein